MGLLSEDPCLFQLGCPPHGFDVMPTIKRALGCLSRPPINVGPMTMELGFPFTLNFATLYLDENQNLYW
jgi:hypothetical protein